WKHDPQHQSVGKNIWRFSARFDTAWWKSNRRFLRGGQLWISAFLKEDAFGLGFVIDVIRSIDDEVYRVSLTFFLLFIEVELTLYRRKS
ncbi:MAG: hypothetical protein ACYS7Y_35945, partial [Planctomycetota bacterium]